MKHIHTFENFLSEAKNIKQLAPGSEKAIADLAYSMPNHTKPDDNGKFSDEAIEKAIKKYSPFLVKHLKSGMRDEIISRVKEIVNESFLNEKKQEFGLYVTGKTSSDNNKIGDWLEDSDFHAEWNAREGYWLFPADSEDEYDELEKDLDKEFSKHHINARFEGIFESLSANDPVLIAMRAAREDRKKTLAVHKENLKKRVYGKQREKLEDELWQISQDLRDAYTDRKNTYADMDAEAGEKGDKWTDDDANRYGAMLNKIDDEIEKLISKRQTIEIKLAY